MTAETARTCRPCGQPVEYVKASWKVDVGTFRDANGFRMEFFHVGGGALCADGGRLELQPRCPKCGSTEYVFDSSDPWADYSRCGACGHVDRRSLGD